MTRKTKLVEDLTEYFTKKGKFLSYNEYIQQDDVPYRPQLIKRTVGSWARLERMIGEIEAPKPVAPPPAPPAPKPAATEKK
jgi:hypothetical protein